jgi:quercetin dioxygenase-like cupin family protein
MTVIISADEKRDREVREPGYSKTLQRILVSQKEGCNRLSVRMLTIRSGGHIPRREIGNETICHILEGTILFMDGDGFITSLKPGDTVIIRPHERHLFRNESESNVRILVASSI